MMKTCWMQFYGLHSWLHFLCRYDSFYALVSTRRVLSFYCYFQSWLHLESLMVSLLHFAFPVLQHVGHQLNERWILQLLDCLSHPQALLVIMLLFLSEQQSWTQFPGSEIRQLCLFAQWKMIKKAKKQGMMSKRTWMELRKTLMSMIKMEMMRNSSFYPLMTHVMAWRWPNQWPQVVLCVCQIC